MDEFMLRDLTVAMVILIASMIVILAVAIYRNLYRLFLRWPYRTKKNSRKQGLVQGCGPECPCELGRVLSEIEETAGMMQPDEEWGRE